MQVEPERNIAGSAPVDLHRLLEQHFGFAAFRAGQEEIVRAVLAGEDVLAIMPTGFGKSLCFQLPALLLPGVTVVVSPLIALMKDQVDALNRRGIKATYVNSSLSLGQQSARLAELRRGDHRLCYVAPERFRSRAFLEAIAASHVALFAVDEAHCISQWGHDFRPDYLRLARAIELLGRPRVGAFTATATGAVAQDIARGLGLVQPRCFTFGFDRPNLHISCCPVRARRDKLPLLQDVISRRKTGIVYTATRGAADELCDELSRSGVAVGCYHAGLRDEERHSVQDAFMQGRLPVVVATNAFGMGIDKPDVRFVVHQSVPRSFEAYYQEIGRAGRDGETSECLLLFQAGDTAVQRFLIEASHPEMALTRDLYRALRSERSRAVCLPNTELKRRIAPDAADTTISAALRVLEDADLIERSFGSGRTQVLLGRGGPAGTPLAAALLSALQATGERSWIEVDPFALADGAGVELADVNRGLDQLQRERLIEMVPPTRDRVILLLDDQDWEERLAAAHAPLEARRLRELGKLADVVAFVFDPRCRREAILRHFTGRGPAAPCAHCDRCAEGASSGKDRRSPERAEIEDTVTRKILSAVGRMRGGYGKAKVVQVLKGSKSSDLPEALTRLSVFGILAELPRATIGAALDELIALGAVEKLRGEFPTVRLTRLGFEVACSRHALRLRSLTSLLPSEREPAAATQPADTDAVLLDRLRDWRAQTAAAAGLPRYAIFHDRTLVEIAARRPRSAEAFACIHGVGPRKLELYWTAVRDLIDRRELDLVASAAEPTSRS
jgi:ATP-dependent DNA helicase RecQ